MSKLAVFGRFFSSCWMTQGENKEEKPQIISKFTNHLVLIAVIKLLCF